MQKSDSNIKKSIFKNIFLTISFGLMLFLLSYPAIADTSPDTPPYPPTSAPNTPHETLNTTLNNAITRWQEYTQTLNNTPFPPPSISQIIRNHPQNSAPTPPESNFQSSPLNLSYINNNSAIESLNVLSNADEERYRQIFQSQERGDMATAAHLIISLDNNGLMGHVLYQRYMHPTAWHSTYAELYSWLNNYADHPNANRLYNLAIRRRPENLALPPHPIRARGIAGNIETYGFTASSYNSPQTRNSADRLHIETLKNTINNFLDNGEADFALQHLTQNTRASNLLDNTERDQILTDIAASYFFTNRPENALDLAEGTAARSGEIIPYSNWISGLAAWRLDDPEKAMPHFENVGTSTNISPWMRAAGSYWASRCAMRLSEPREVSLWLRRAAIYSHTFYGLVATETLGAYPDFNWSIPPLTAGHINALAANSSGWRGLALLQIGQNRLAAEEFLRIHPHGDAELSEALIAISDYGNLPDLALRAASAIVDNEGYRYDAALYPIPPWQPEGGFELDRALIYAFMRQESRFRPEAQSGIGARGLMQLMPTTATYIDPQSRDFSGRNSNRLFNTALNLKLGQTYLAHLLGLREVDGNLLRLTIAYNAGPGNLRRWTRRFGDIDDALLFIESIPASETREFVERVLTNYWIYRIHLGKETPALTALATGNPAIYRGINGFNHQIANTTP